MFFGGGQTVQTVLTGGYRAWGSGFVAQLGGSGCWNLWLPCIRRLLSDDASEA